VVEPDHDQIVGGRLATLKVAEAGRNRTRKEAEDGVDTADKEAKTPVSRPPAEDGEDGSEQ
jgi:hypothetical protein